MKTTHFPRTTMAAIALVVAGMMTATAARATIVTNGDFEAGDFSGWTQTGDVAFTGVDAFAPRAGSYAAFFGSPGGTTLSQTLSTHAGTSYRVEFWLQLAQDDFPTSFSWDWGGETQASLVDSPPFGYTSFSAVVTAVGANTALSFSFVNEPGFFDFDEVSVTQVPEPSSFGMALVGLALVTAAYRGRRRQRAIASRSSSTAMMAW